MVIAIFYSRQNEGLCSSGPENKERKTEIGRNCGLNSSHFAR